MKIEEIRIPAPWGHIAAKLWGSSTDEAIIASHGFQDNAGTFDRLIPYLPQHFFYICFDLPGHGFSTPLHNVTPIYSHNLLLALKLVADYFKKSKYILLGHSFGGILSIVFAQVYPEIVSKLIVLDAVYYEPYNPDAYISLLKEAHELYFKRSGRKIEDRPTYAYEEVVEKIRKGRMNGWLTFETAEDLAKRMIEPVGAGRYAITTNIKLALVVFPSVTAEYNIEQFDKYPVKCPVLMLLAPVSDTTIKCVHMEEHFKKVGFRVKTIDCQHHSHQTDPHTIAPDVVNFLNEKASKL